MTQNNDAKEEVQLVIFRLGNEEYAFDILMVQEIKRMTDITRVPHTPDYIKGVINLRGSVLPVLDLKIRMNLPETPITEDTRIIIIKMEKVLVGMLVDSVSEVVTLNFSNIELPQGNSGIVAENYVSGIGKIDQRLLIILDPRFIVDLV
ncbi:MAG: CheW protein [Firmicutes bacterium]|nr:CheW protein [Bacillota bacterium]